MTREEFAARFKAARQATGLTQVQAAEQIGIPQSRIAEYETAVAIPSAVKLFEIVQVLGLDPAILFPEWFAARPRRRRTAKSEIRENI